MRKGNVHSMKKRNLLLSLASIAVLLASCQNNPVSGNADNSIGGTTPNATNDVLTDDMLKSLKDGYSFTGVKVTNNPSNSAKTPFKVDDSDGVYNYVSGRWTEDNTMDFSFKSAEYNIYSDKAKGDSQLVGDEVGKSYAANHYLTLGNQVEYEPMFIATAKYDPDQGATIESRVLSFEESYENLFKSITASDFEQEGDFTYTLKEDVLDDALALKIGSQFNGRADKNYKASKFTLLTDGSKVTDVSVVLGGREDSFGYTINVDGTFVKSGSGLSHKVNPVEGTSFAPLDDAIKKLKENNWSVQTTVYGGKDSSGKDNHIGNALDVAQNGLFLEEEYDKNDTSLQGKPTSQTLYYDKKIEGANDGATFGVQRAVYVAHKKAYYDYSTPAAGKYIKYYYPSFNISSVFFTQDTDDASIYHLNTDMLNQYYIGIDGSFFTSYNYELPVETLDVKVEANQATFTFTSNSVIDGKFVIRYFDIGTTTGLPQISDIQTSSENLTWDDLFLDTEYSSSGTYENYLIPQAGGKTNLDLVPTLGGTFPQANIASTEFTPREGSSTSTMYEITYMFNNEDEFKNSIGENTTGVPTDGTWDEKCVNKGFAKVAPKDFQTESPYVLTNSYKVYKKENATDDKGNKGTLYATLEVLAEQMPHRISPSDLLFSLYPKPKSIKI